MVRPPQPPPDVDFVTFYSRHCPFPFAPVMITLITTTSPSNKYITMGHSRPCTHEACICSLWCVHYFSDTRGNLHRQTGEAQRGHQRPERVKGQTLIEWARCSVCSECVLEGGWVVSTYHRGAERTPGSGVLTWAGLVWRSTFHFHSL